MIELKEQGKKRLGERKMPERTRRKKNKLRGNRTHGRGNTKNGRGGGSKGGRGRAGSHKHKYSKYYKDFGKHGFTRKNQKETKAIKLCDLNEMIEELANAGKIQKTQQGYELNLTKLGYNKITGRGETSYKLVITNGAATKKATEKIEAAGGKLG